MNTSRLVALEDSSATYEDILQRIATEGRRAPGQLLELVESKLDRFRESGTPLPLTTDQIALSPAVMHRTTRHRLGLVMRIVLSAMRRAASQRSGADWNTLASLTGVREQDQRELSVLASDPVRPSSLAPMARPDLVVTPDRRVKVVEANATTSIGHVGALHLLSKIASAILDATGISEQYEMRTVSPFDALASFILRTAQSSLAHGLVLVGDWVSEYERRPYHYEIVAGQLRERGVPAISGPLEDLEIQPNAGSARHRSNSVRVIYYYGPPTESSRSSEIHESMVDACSSGNISLIGTLPHRVLISKVVLSWITDSTFLEACPRWVASIIRECVPWSVLLEDRPVIINGGRVGLPEHVVEHQRDYVLKPAMGYFGAEVAIGHLTTTSMWRQLVETAVNDERGWIVQEAVPGSFQDILFATPSGVERDTRAVDYGAVIVDDRFAGGSRQHGAAGLHTACRYIDGGGVAPTYVLR